MFQGETVLSGAQTTNVSDFKVMSSPAGCYIGTTIAEGYGDLPYSRESEYFASRDEALEALAEWESVVNEFGDEPTEFADVARNLRRAYRQGCLRGART